jgi:hypothetical protein
MEIPMRIAAFCVLTICLLAFPALAAAEGGSVIVCVIEKSSGELQPVGMAKTVISGVLAKNGWSVIDTNEYPVTASGEDLNSYFLEKGGKNQYKSNSISASITHAGDIRLDTNNVESASGRDLRRLDWRIDQDKLTALAAGAQAKYIIYGEITTKAVPARGLPEGFASEGYTSVIAVANLRLVETSTKAVISTFVDQVPAMQLTKETAAMNAIQGVGTRAGEYFAKALAAPVKPSETPAPAR